MSWQFKLTARAMLSVMISAPLQALPPPAPTVLIGSTSWNVDYADDSCRLARAFGTDEKRITVVFDRFGPGPGSFKLRIAGRPFERMRLGEAEITFGPEQLQRVAFLPGSLGKDRPALVLVGEMRFDKEFRDGLKKPTAPIGLRAPEVAPLSDQRIAAIADMTIGRPLRQHIRLKLGAMTKPLAALDACVADLVHSWGIDAASYAMRTRDVVPRGSPAEWVTNDDYPRRAQQNGEQALIEFRLSIDDAGKPTACHIQQAAQAPEINKVACDAMMRRAMFVPALDKDGKPMPSFFRGAFLFQIQG